MARIWKRHSNMKQTQHLSNILSVITIHSKNKSFFSKKKGLIRPNIQGLKMFDALDGGHASY